MNYGLQELYDSVIIVLTIMFAGYGLATLIILNKPDWMGATENFFFAIVFVSLLAVGAISAISSFIESHGDDSCE